MELDFLSQKSPLFATETQYYNSILILCLIVYANYALPRGARFYLLLKAVVLVTNLCCFCYKIQALREIGKDNITEEEEEKVIKLLGKENPELLEHDIFLAPVWIQKIMKKAL
jgi:hypothetical protein